MIAESLRRGPQTEAEWLGPLPVRTWFAHPERRLEVDLGCGKGLLSLELARRYPDRLILGSDVMLGRLRRIERKRDRRGLENLVLLRADNLDLASYLLPHDCIQFFDQFFDILDCFPQIRCLGRQTFVTFLNLMEFSFSLKVHCSNAPDLIFLLPDGLFNPFW